MHQDIPAHSSATARHNFTKNTAFTFFDAHSGPCHFLPGLGRRRHFIGPAKLAATSATVPLVMVSLVYAGEKAFSLPTSINN